MAKKSRDPRPMELCRLRETVKLEHRPTGIGYGQVYLYLGEIGNMPGHGAFVELDRTGRGRTFVGLHPDSFRALSEEET